MLPDKLSSCVETFITAINHDIKSSKTKKLPRDNLTKSEREALLNLQKRNDIIITKADKGGAVVILDINDYIDEANRQLNDTNNYEQLDFDPTELHTELNNLKNENLLTLRTANSLLEEKIKTPEFHLLPKKHKANNSGRPVISSVNCRTSRISEFVDYYLQPEVKKLKSYVKDTTDFIKKIEAIDHVSDDSYLVSLDVPSLYTNIPHKEGIEAVKQKLKKSKPSISIKVILTFLKLILTLNNFVFNGINYLQKKGCAMGTKCAPSYANIFMGWFEEKFIPADTDVFKTSSRRLKKVTTSCDQTRRRHDVWKITSDLRRLEDV